ncbi:hypothetical protein AQS8620_00544 [Aquimixticola soesokkakensis]|uniref:Hedgehog/Intein (Hint) domain-containing protein n=1 Tax=Aquimixticola soesokkakensis TaxID=1519096 RepID=A0A1Y5RM30_9RHOB|nr:Hint domain-containing protein [Aquimixticola soesokkakensis]SLN20682.1 hypothetical protein AQS8620_00544 [Aquimixticola soesokkakensis]
MSYPHLSAPHAARTGAQRTSAAKSATPKSTPNVNSAMHDCVDGKAVAKPATAWTVRRVRSSSMAAASARKAVPACLYDDSAPRTAPAAAPLVPPAPVESLPLRKYEVLWRGANGDILDLSQRAPATAVFEAAFSALARGALIATPNGPVAVEDLLPGDLVDTVDGAPMAVDWIGSMQVTPDAVDGPCALYRVAADSFGFGRPGLDLMLGPNARILHRAPALRSYLGTDQALVPIAALADGISVINVTPMASVRTYHIALAQHRLIKVNGFPVETYHPGASASAQLPPPLRAQFMALFPHIHELGDFGAMALARLSVGDLEKLDAA